MSQAKLDGSVGPVTRVVDNFGYDAGASSGIHGSWPIRQATVGSTLSDSETRASGPRALAGGGYEAPQLIITNFGYDAGGWRVEQHPRFVVDMTGDGRAEIVGFGNAGVWMAMCSRSVPFIPALDIV